MSQVVLSNTINLRKEFPQCRKTTALIIYILFLSIPSMSGPRDLLLMVKIGIVRILSYYRVSVKLKKIFRITILLRFGTIRQRDLFGGVLFLRTINAKGI